MLCRVSFAVGVVAAFAVVLVSAAPSFVQYQEWFNNYSAIGEQTMQLKRAINSNITRDFNQLLLLSLGNATAELRRIGEEAMETMEGIEVESQPCREHVYQMFGFYIQFAENDLKDCVRGVMSALTPLTTDNFFRYANFISRELSRITHHAIEALSTYNKILEMDNIDARLEQDYYDFNWVYNQYQTILNSELGRFDDEEHPIVVNLEGCLERTVYEHEGDMFYLLTYLEYYCNP